MSLASKLAEASSNPKLTKCKVGVILLGSQLSKEDTNYLDKALNVPEGSPDRLSNVSIARVLREEGFDLSNSAVDRHRRNECSCARKATK
jgi:hypothetical protein